MVRLTAELDEQLRLRAVPELAKFHTPTAAAALQRLVLEAVGSGYSRNQALIN
ncbi:MAG TPA: hypothetical protein VLH75_14285 [Longimicrobiales bacterium]|nr:hypothetical protein [Longimicrobiales bacterium]